MDSFVRQLLIGGAMAVAMATGVVIDRLIVPKSIVGIRGAGDLSPGAEQPTCDTGNCAILVKPSFDAQKRCRIEVKPAAVHVKNGVTILWNIDASAGGGASFEFHPKSGIDVDADESSPLSGSAFSCMRNSPTQFQCKSVRSDVRAFAYTIALQITSSSNALCIVDPVIVNRG